MTKESFDYQEAVKEIEAILAEIESGEPNVNELSDLVHKAAALLATCKEKLPDFIFFRFLCKNQC